MNLLLKRHTTVAALLLMALLWSCQAPIENNIPKIVEPASNDVKITTNGQTGETITINGQDPEAVFRVDHG